jgi:quercetin dioxygenase-like cupin family protein
MTHGRTIPLVLALILCFAAFAWADEMHPMGQNPAQMKFTKFPNFPSCATGAVVNGDPAKGPSIILAKMTAGCTIPWHWHTPAEHLMMVSGSARLETKDGKPFTLRTGGFSMLPPHHVHNFHANTACTMYVYSDAPFDIHYVNAEGSEISFDDAMHAKKH